MGQARRRKESGEYPVVTPKPRSETRIKNNVGYGGYYPGMFTHLAIMSGLMDRRRP